MSKNTITIFQGETLQLPVTNDDLSAETVQLLVWDDNGTIIDETENFTVNDDLAEATISVLVNATPATYEYLLVLTYSDGVVEKLPDVTNCGGRCSLPEFIVCEANPEEA